MREKLRSMKRETGKWHDILPIAIIWSVLLLWSVFIIGYTPVEKAITGALPYSSDVTDFLLFFFSFIKVWIILIPIFLIRYNRPMLSELLPSKGGNMLSGSLIGFLLGFGTNGACILFSVLMGDIRLTYSGFDPALVLLFLFVILIQCGAEEIIDRLYLYQKLRRRYVLPVIAIAGSSIAFVGNHIFATGFSIIPALLIVLTGILLALFVFYYDCLWAAIMFHTAWNFSQSTVFGLPNSGEVSAYSIFTMDVSTAKNGFFYDVVFGVEGSIGASLIIAIVTAVVIWINRGKREKKDLWG